MELTPTQKMVALLYRDEKGQPIQLSPAQDYLFQCIYAKKYPRMHVMNFTRWGKSMTIALAVLSRAAIYPEKWAIVAGTKDKAQIIMEYIVQHIFDNQFTTNRFVPDEGDKLTIDEIRRHKSKAHLTFVINPEERDPTKRLLSEITIGSAKDALGKGAKNVVEDEAGVIGDQDHALVMRMLGDDPFENFLVKIGNPFKRNHFLRSLFDPHYVKMVVDCYRGIADGRITKETIEEMKQEAFFSILYECKFPAENAVDEEGYMPLLLKADIQIAQQRQLEPVGLRRLGVDVARGGRNYNAFVLRGDNWAQVLEKNHEPNSVRIADRVEQFMKQYNIPARAVFIDDTGVGHGVVSILWERGIKVIAVNFGFKAASEKYFNKKAEVFAGEYGVMTWIKQGAQLVKNPDWEDLLNVRYRKNTGNKTQIEPKERMIKRGLESPDVADALALTFAKRNISVYTNNIVQNAEESVRPFGGVAKYIEGIG